MTATSPKENESGKFTDVERRAGADMIPEGTKMTDVYPNGIMLDGGGNVLDEDVVTKLAHLLEDSRPVSTGLIFYQVYT